VLAAGAALLWPGMAAAQTGTVCSVDGYRVTARQWDAILAKGWELRQSCAHPEWPARMVATGAAGLSGSSAAAAQMGRPNQAALEIVPRSMPAPLPLLVRAGDAVRLWSQGERVRIEMSGVVEQSARGGDRVVVRVIRQTDDAGLTVERIAGTVRGAGDVEMEMEVER
jgi:hypothetical protein